MAKREIDAPGKKILDRANGKTENTTIDRKHTGKTLAKGENRYFIYAVILLVLLVLFAIEPGFFLGLIIGAVTYRYYVNHFK